MKQKYILIILLVINVLKLISTQTEKISITLINVEEFSIENGKLSFIVYAKVNKGTMNNSRFSISSITAEETINGSKNKIDVSGTTCIQGETKGEFITFNCETPYTRNSPNSELEFSISPKKNCMAG